MADSENGQSLTVAEILKNAKPPVIERVETPAWGGHVYVRELSADQRDQFEWDQSQAESLVGVRRKLLAACLCDANGKRAAVSETQLDALGRIGGCTVDRVFAVCQRINGMTLAAVEEAEKNSEPVGVSDSG